MKKTNDILFGIRQRVNRLKNSQIEYYEYFIECLENFEQQKKVGFTESLGEDKYNNFINVLTDDELFKLPSNQVFSNANEATDFFEFLFDLESIEDCFDTFNKSYVMHLHSILENFLNEICNIQGDHKDLSLKDIHGKGVPRALIYLKKVCKIKLTPEYESNINLFLKVRNKIIHNNSVVDNSEVEFYSRIDGIEIVKSALDKEKNILKFDATFCKNSNESVFLLLEDILCES